MEEELMKLQERAIKDPELKSSLLKTRTADDPVRAFCDKCQELGYNITVYELLTMGQSFCEAMLRSVNGGGVEAPDEWDDFYEMFFDALKQSE